MIQPNLPTGAVITGMGLVCALGNDRKSILSAICAGETGLRAVSTLDLSALDTEIAGEIKPDGQGPTPDNWTQYSSMVRTAFSEAHLDSALQFQSIDPFRIGIILGTCNANLPAFERLLEKKHDQLVDFAEVESSENYWHTRTVFPDIPDDCIQFLYDQFGVRGPKLTFVSACAASNQAIAYAQEIIQADQVDVVVVIGADILSLSTFAGFHALQSLSKLPCSPFSDRIGISLGAGAGVLIVEKRAIAAERGAKIYAEILGYGSTNDAYHATAPDKSGIGAGTAMKTAILDSGVAISDVQVVVAHGTGTLANDHAETAAIRFCLGAHADQIKVTSTKSLYGHTLGAAGVTQAIVTVDCMWNGIVPPICYYSRPRPGCDLPVVTNRPLPYRYDTILSNSFAFAGNNVSILLSRSKSRIRSDASRTARVVISAAGGVCPRFGQTSEFISILTRESVTDLPKFQSFDYFHLSDPRFRRFGSASKITRMAIEATQRAFGSSKHSDCEKVDYGILVGISRGPVSTFIDYYNGLLETGIQFGSARAFQHTVMNAVAGQLAIAFGMKGINTTILGQFSPFSCLKYGYEVFQRGHLNPIVIVGCDELSDWDKNFQLSFPDRDASSDEIAGISEGAAAIVIERLESARQFNRPILGEICGFAATSFAPGRLDLTSYEGCLDRTLLCSETVASEIDYHIQCLPGSMAIERYQIPTINIQLVVGRMDAASAIFSIWGGILELIGQYSTGIFSITMSRPIRTILVSAASLSGTCTSFILKKET